jgi:hypothetical protein
MIAKGDIAHFKNGDGRMGSGHELAFLRLLRKFPIGNFSSPKPEGEHCDSSKKREHDPVEPAGLELSENVYFASKTA